MMQFNYKSLSVFSLLIAGSLCPSLVFTGDNFHDRQMSLRMQDANNAKKIITQHKDRVTKIKNETDSEHRRASEAASQKSKLARQITNTKQRNASLRLINQESAKLHNEINARKKTRNQASAKLKTAQLKSSHEKYAKQIKALESERKKTLSDHKKLKSSRKTKSNAPQQSAQTPRRAFSKDPIPTKS